MQEKHLFEYAVIRIVPRVEREEFINIGVILYCATQNFLHCQFQIDEPRLLSFANHIDMDELKPRLLAFEQICSGSPAGGPIGRLPIGSRFRWLTSKRSTVIQLSPVHPGLCSSADETLLKLHDQLVKCELI